MPWLGLPVQTGLVLENGGSKPSTGLRGSDFTPYLAGHEYLSKTDIVYLNLLRRKDGLKVHMGS